MSSGLRIGSHVDRVRPCFGRGPPLTTKRFDPGYTRSLRLPHLHPVDAAEHAESVLAQPKKFFPLTMLG